MSLLLCHYTHYIATPFSDISEEMFEMRERRKWHDTPNAAPDVTRRVILTYQSRPFNSYSPNSGTL